MPSSAKISANRCFERGRWNSTVSAFTSRKLTLRKSHAAPMSRRVMCRTSIIGPLAAGFFFPRDRFGALAGGLSVQSSRAPRAKQTPPPGPTASHPAEITTGPSPGRHAPPCAGTIVAR